MSNLGLNMKPLLEGIANQPRNEARRDVLLTGSNRHRRDQFGGIFKQRGLTLAEAADCRDGITASFLSDLRLAVILGENEDPYMGALINSLWCRHPRPGIWLIGNPHELHLSEIVSSHEVAVLPPNVTLNQFEQTLFAFGESSTAQSDRPSVPVHSSPEIRMTKRIDHYRQAKAAFEKRFLLRALRQFDGNVCQTARAIGIHRRNLQLKIRSLAIDIESTRAGSPANGRVA